MSSTTDDPIAAYLRLLQEAGLGRIEDLRRHDPGSRQARLMEANRRLNLLEGLPGEEVLSRLVSETAQSDSSEITIGALRHHWPDERPYEFIGEGASVGAAVGSAPGQAGGYRAFDIVREDFGLPGKEDFDLPRRPGDDDL